MYDFFKNETRYDIWKGGGHIYANKGSLSQNKLSD